MEEAVPGLIPTATERTSGASSTRRGVGSGDAFIGAAAVFDHEKSVGALAIPRKDSVQAKEA